MKTIPTDRGHVPCSEANIYDAVRYSQLLRLVYQIRSAKNTGQGAAVLYEILGPKVFDLINATTDRIADELIREDLK